MLFPLGCSCKLRYSIERFTNEKKETNLFDWVLTNFETILYYVENIDKEIISDQFYDSNITIYDNRIVNHKEIRFSSIHDFPLIVSYEENMLKFIEMVNRRLKRFKNTIINSNNIDFIHILDDDTEYNFKYNQNFRKSNLYIPSSESVIKFINTIKKINNNLNFILHILIPPNSNNFYDLIKPLENINNAKIHYLTKDDSIDPFMFQCRHWSWDNVYLNLKTNNLPSDFNATLYKKINEDLSNLSDSDAIDHFISNGIYEGRKYIYTINDLPSDFNPTFYKKINEDLSNLSDSDAIYHFISNGIYKDRKYVYTINNLPSDFNVKLYKKIKDLSNLSDSDAIHHFINNGIYEYKKYILYKI